MNAMPPVLSDLGREALAYAARGWPVFPVKPGAKEPMGGHGHLDATSDADQVRRWWTATPDANIGLHLAAAGLVAVDADTYKPECQWANFIEGRDLPATLVQRSASGGTHYIFRADPGASYVGKPCEGVDTKHQGYILLEPSRFAGGIYQWQTDDDPAPVPAWVPVKGRAPEVHGHLTDGERDTILEALHDRPNDLSRDDWVRLAFAVKHELGDAGEAAWLAFSARYAGPQKAGEAARVWRTAKPSGDVGIGTVLHLIRSAPAAGASRLRTARDLQHRVFPPIKWIVPGFLPEGLTVLAGPPKVGKSWLTLDIALAVATGGEVLGQKVEQGDVLLLALEDNDRRLQDRLDKLTGDEDWPEALHYATDWPRLDQGGLQAIADWIDSVPNPRLIIIDTLAKVKPLLKGKGGTAYDNDVAALGPLHRQASDRRVSTLPVTHQRKMETDDPLESVSGSFGITGTADTTAVLVRGPGGMGNALYARGRDIAEFERAVKLVDFRWQIQGDPLEVFAGDTRKAILKAIREGATTPKAIETASGLSGTAVRKTLGRMLKRDEVIKTARGEYGVNPPSQASQGHNEGAQSDSCD